ncbi:MAG TPA: TetR/AcrR family transcriptional regulator [Caulobacteraceae bacterium]|jgi:TetR/AcrR family transcriptional repressor of nem operon
MPRPREFDETAVLDAATTVFWARGFKAASTRELVEAMGVTTASLYNAYGDKRALYRLVLDRYASGALTWCASTLDEGPSAAAALDRFFEALSQETLSGEARQGCLVVNAGLEAGPHDPEFQTVVADVFSRISALFCDCVRRGQADGSITQAQSAEDLAGLLLSVMLGLRVIARTQPEPAVVLGLVRSATTVLRP